MSPAARVLVVLLAGLAAFAGGWGAAIKWRRGVDAQAQLASSETAREAERLASMAQTRISDALTRDRLATERRASDADRRLRELADATPTPAGCPGRNDDARPAAGVLSDATRVDLERLTKEADEVADRLRACQRRIDL